VAQLRSGPLSAGPVSVAASAAVDTSEPLMPGGGISKRPLHLIVMADCSGSMKGEKMQALNYALRSMLPHLAAWEVSQLQAELFIRILAFATVPQWHIGEPTPVADMSQRWRDLTYVPRGLTNMGPAFQEIAQALKPDNLERRALRPAILLVTDGQPTDPPGGFELGLMTLMGRAAGRSALRLAVAVGRDANSGPLNRFRSPDTPVLIAESIDDIVDRLVTASIAVSRMSEAGADRNALAQQLLQVDPDPGAAHPDDTIL
jgi:uncharacterized protein YegL